MICGVCKSRGVDIAHVRAHKVDLLHKMLRPVDQPRFEVVEREPVTEEGVYSDAGHYFNVVRSERGYLYAKVWDGEHWAYSPAAIKYLKADMRVTAEQAKRFGDLWNRCVFCARKLTNTDPGCSVDRGYGETCADNNGLPWGPE